MNETISSYGRLNYSTKRNSYNRQINIVKRAFYVIPCFLEADYKLNLAIHTSIFRRNHHGVSFDERDVKQSI